MIKSFKQSWLEEFWHSGKHKRVPTELEKRLTRKCSPPSNHLHPLHGDRQGQWAISVSRAWRICFEFEDGDIFEVELVQYH
ncbi:MAG: type II toxin-antitoxin system RelE/ParE family toxin [bacterium]